MICCLAFNQTFSRESSTPFSLGTLKEFKNSFSKADPENKKYYVLKLESNREVEIRIENNECKKNSCFVFGKVVGQEQATFFIKGDGKSVSGKVIFQKTKEAYDIYTNNTGGVFIIPIDIHKVICIDYNEYKGDGENDGEGNAGSSKNNDGTLVAPLLNSLPGAINTLYLDFDGENVTGSSWGNINAAASSFTNANITTIWTAVSEDYSPFNVNVTTDLAVFTAAPSNKRMKVIFTPTNTAAPGAGGVAFLNSFGSGEPCWIFNNSVKSAEEAASHELGHTMGLNHDGRTTPQEEYFAGQGTWGPIMGAVYTRAIVQWSKGEYTAASNTEDDLVKISSKISYRVDDAGNTIAAAKNLVVTGTGSVAAASNFGIIEKRTDLDVFKFTTTGGAVTLTTVAKTESGSASVPDLDIQARLLDAAGTEIIKVEPTGVLSTAVTISQTLAAGTYYLEIDGVGYGTALSTGYSDYGSLGQYFISGTVPGGASTGVNEAMNNHTVNVFPNPSSGVFTIDLPLEGNNETSIVVLNNLGQPVLTSSENNTGNIHKQIDLSGYASGIYCIVVRAGNDAWKGKMILK